jgi:hypothetical protein
MGVSDLERGDMRAVIRCVILAIALVSCRTEQRASDPVASSSARSEAPTPSSSETATPTTSPPAPPHTIRVGSLPQEGVAVDLGHRVELIDLDGRILARLSGSSLYYDWTVPGDVALRQGDAFFVLREERGVFRLLPNRGAAADLDPQFQRHVGLPRPVHTVPGGGYWAYALPGPNGLVLAQWSGECEVPNAMFVAPGQVPVGVTGERRLSRAPESRGLGWDDRGRAIVHLQEGECGTSFERPGIYAFTGPGVGELVYPDRKLVAARMWGAPA